ncbi:MULTISPECIES: type VII secretion target [Amycolatopsis]|uniref:ESX-1 secretion-associated protein n=1 Tax=Amycolatopsis bullii TaxID=941987 RepID=A0ABQ3KJB6_9PSEU|nr:type VII secretion target [Amycolatopsis bullii]GHG30010.1 hypothetical protein GCM10017567_57310 [Amycolatopsis bullii]
MPDGYQVDPDDLARHRGHVEALADELREAHSAARGVALPTEAYGRICQFFPSRLDPAEDKGVEALLAAVEGMTEVARSLGVSGARYGDTERKHTDAFRRGLAR